VRAAALIAFVAFAAAPAFAGPTPAAAALADAQAHWHEQDYDDVVEAAGRALAANPTRDEQIEALWLEGEAFVVLKRNDDAVAAFEKLFALDPDYTPPDGTSPGVLVVFDPARAAWFVKEQMRLQTELGAAYAAMSIRVTLPANARGGRPIAVAIELADPQHITDELIVSFRVQGEKHWSTMSAVARPGHIELSIPGAITASPTPYELELTVRARHRSGMTLRQEGNPEHPLVLAVAAGAVPVSTPVTHRWWFWTGTTALVVAAVAIPILVDQSRSVGVQRVRIFSSGLVLGRW
jgi:tetratricopeptide (TPR) repeat protein